MLAALSLLAGGCYRYIPTSFDAIPEGGSVRLYVSRNVVNELSEALPEVGPVLRGRVARMETDRLFLRIPVGGRQVGFHTAPIDQEVPIPLREITQVERRQLDRVGTAAMIGGMVGVGAVVILVIMDAFGDPPIEENCPECADMRLPILSLPVR